MKCPVNGQTILLVLGHYELEWNHLIASVSRYTTMLNKICMELQILYMHTG